MNFSYENLCLRLKVCRLRKGMVIKMEYRTMDNIGADQKAGISARSSSIIWIRTVRQH